MPSIREIGWLGKGLPLILVILHYVRCCIAREHKRVDRGKNLIFQPSAYVSTHTLSIYPLLSIFSLFPCYIHGKRGSEDALYINAEDSDGSWRQVRDRFLPSEKLVRVWKAPKYLRWIEAKMWEKACGNKRRLCIMERLGK